MIKVNLLRNRGGSGASTSNTSAAEIDYEPTFDAGVAGDSSSKIKDIVVKLLVMGLGIGGLMIYESLNISELKTQNSQLSKQKQTLTSEIQQKQSIAEKAMQLQKEINDLEARIKVIKDLSKVRLREIKAIDYLQNVIPERVWFTRVEFREETLLLEGGAMSDDQLNRLMDAMEGKSYFRNVILLKAVEQKSKEGTVKMFQISSSLTNAD